VLLRMTERRHDKLSAPWAGPFLVLDSAPADDGGNVATIQHLSNKRVTRAHVKDLKRCSLDHYSNIDEALPLAALDSFEYLVERILNHRPAGKRKQAGKRPRPKRDYEFEVLWSGLPLEEGENPSWESWSNQSLRTCEAYKTYCSQPEVSAVLGSDFYAGEADDAEPALNANPTQQRKRQRPNQARSRQ
jgi:hypothetical protein